MYSTSTQNPSPTVLTQTDCCKLRRLHLSQHDCTGLHSIRIMLSPPEKNMQNNIPSSSHQSWWCMTVKKTFGVAFLSILESAYKLKNSAAVYSKHQHQLWVCENENIPRSITIEGGWGLTAWLVLHLQGTPMTTAPFFHGWDVNFLAPPRFFWINCIIRG